MQYLRSLFALMLVATAGLALTAMHPAGGNEAPAGGYKVGDEAADFKLKSTTGKMVSLSDFEDAKGFIVVFTCNHCPYVKLYEDRIESLNRTYEPLGYPVIAINPNDEKTYPSDDFKHMVERAEEKEFTFPYLRDGNQEVAATYGARKTPEAFVLEKVRGKYIVRYIGAIDDNPKDEDGASKKYVAQAVKALMNNEEVDPKSTKAVGCSIKWAKK